MEYWESLTKILQSLITSSALLIGGIWAYFKFLRGRIYKPRMELNIECEIYLQKNNLALLHIKVVLKNVGLSKVNIDKKSSAVRIHKISKLQHADLMSEKAIESGWCRIATFPLYDQHEWIEPLETIQDQKMIEYKSVDPVFRIEAIVMSETQQWYSSCISVGKPDGE